jgi:hypothetical protein
MQEKENYVCNTLTGEPDVKPSHYYFGQSGSNDAEKDTDPSLNSVLYASLSLLYGLRTAVHDFHGVCFSSSSAMYFVGVSCLPVKLLIVWVDRSLT